jgi:hypothetical protein
MKTFAFVLAALAAISFTVSSADAKTMKHKHKSHHSMSKKMDEKK